MNTELVYYTIYLKLVTKKLLWLPDRWGSAVRNSENRIVDQAPYSSTV